MGQGTPVCGIAARRGPYSLGRRGRFSGKWSRNAVEPAPDSLTETRYASQTRLQVAWFISAVQNGFTITSTTIAIIAIVGISLMILKNRAVCGYRPVANFRRQHASSI